MVFVVTLHMGIFLVFQSLNIMSKPCFSLFLSVFFIAASAGILSNPAGNQVIIHSTGGSDHTEYNIPSYLPEVWYDEDAWTLLVQGHNYYTYFNYYILDADGDCQLSGGIGGGTELIDLPALDPGLCTLRLVAPDGDTYEGTFTVH